MSVRAPVNVQRPAERISPRCPGLLSASFVDPVDSFRRIRDKPAVVVDHIDRRDFGRLGSARIVDRIDRFARTPTVA